MNSGESRNAAAKPGAVSPARGVEKPPKVEKYRRRVLYWAGEAAPVRALAPRGSRELPASALQKPIASVRPCGLRRLRGVWGVALRLFRDAYEKRPPDDKRPPTPLNAPHYQWSPSRRGVYIRAASSTRLTLNGRRRGTASRAFAAENNTCTNPRP